MGRNTVAHICNIYSDELKVVCEHNSTFTFKQMNQLCTTYDRSIHLRLIARRIIDLDRVEKSRVDKSRIEVRHYKQSGELREWYTRNYVKCNGQGKIARENRLNNGV